MQSFVINCRNGDRVDAIGVSVEIALILEVPAIATGEYKYGSLSVASFIDAIDDSLSNKIAGSLHPPTVIPRPPTTTVQRNLLETIVESRSFVGISDLATEHANSCSFGIIRNSYTTDVVSLCDYLTCASSPMIVVIGYGTGKGVMFVEIIRVLGVLKIGQLIFRSEKSL